MRRRSALCSVGDLLWRRHPNGGRVAAVAVPHATAALLLERGWLTVDGVRAVIAEVDQVEPLTGRTSLRILFDEPYPHPHP